MAKKKAKQSSRESLIKKALYNEARKVKHEGCLYPTGTTEPPCANKASAAHSIQNNGVLSELAYDGHVSTMITQPMLVENPILPDFESRGRNEATTFKGLCNPHDGPLFSPIEHNPLDLAEPEHVFLLMYRAALKETHEAEHTQKVTETVFGILRKDDVLPAASKLDDAIIQKPASDATAMAVEKRKLDNMLITKSYEQVDRAVVELPCRSPSLAVNGFFSAGNFGGRECWCALDVFPMGGKHLMVFSFRKHNELAVRNAFLNRLGPAKGRAREQLASQMILANSSNFVVCPTLVDNYTPQQRRSIRNYFWGSTMIEQAPFLDRVEPGWGEELKKEVQRITGGINESDRRLNLFESIS